MYFSIGTVIDKLLLDVLIYVVSYLGRGTRSPVGGTARWLSPDPAVLLLYLPAWFALLSVQVNSLWAQNNQDLHAEEYMAEIILHTSRKIQDMMALVLFSSNSLKIKF